MKSFFAAALAVLVLLSLVAWATSPQAADAQGKIQLVWVTDNNPVRAAQVDLFNKLNPDLHLRIDPMNNAREKVIVQSIGGVGPDLFDSWGHDSLRAFVNSGVAWNIDDRFREFGVDPRRDVWPVALSSFVYKDGVYGFPANVSADAIWYNKDIFDKEGIPYPKPGWTWEELIATAQKLTKRDARGKPVRYGLYLSFDTWNSIVRQHGGRLWSEDGTESLINSPEAIEGLQLSHDIMYKHKVSPSPQEEAALSTQGGWGSGGMTFLMDGRVAMAFGGRWWLNLIRINAKDLRLGVVELPYRRVPTLLGGARCVLVNSKSPRREHALRFIKFLTEEPYNVLLNDQADALAPMMKYCRTPRYMLNPAHPEETYNDVWRAAVERATPEEVNPFVKGVELGPLNTQIDLIKGDLKPVPEALRDAEKGMNERIRRQAQIRPDLRALWVERTGAQP